jgi:hypothetical protein
MSNIVFDDEMGRMQRAIADPRSRRSAHRPQQRHGSRTAAIHPIPPILKPKIDGRYGANCDIAVMQKLRFS